MGGQNIDESQDTLGIIKAKAHTIQHAATSTADHTFPGGTANYLRADGSWVTPPTGSGTPSDTVISGTAYGLSSAAGTSSEYSRGDHTHGSVADLVSGTAHATLSTGVHGAGTATLATTADITTHAALTSVHSLASMAFAASADYTGTATYAAHTASAAVHGVAQVAGTADITTHSNLTSNIHGSGTATLATTANITTHASLTSVHSLNTASTADVTTLATTAGLASHTASVATHGVAGTIAAKADITDTVLITADVTTNDVTSTKHGFVPKSTADTSLFLRNGATPSWAAPPGGAGILSTTYKSGTQAFSTTALADVTGMNFACASTTIYHYKFLPMFKSGTATVGLKWSVTYPASTIAAGRVSMMVTASGTTAYFHGLISASGTAVTGTSVVAANTIGIAIIEGIVRATAAGSIQLRAAAEAAGTVWVMDNSVGLLYTIA